MILKSIGNRTIMIWCCE